MQVVIHAHMADSSLLLYRATIRPYFPGHVLFFGPEISVQADFVNYMKSPEFWPNP